MDSTATQSFFQAAESEISSARSSLLIAAQTGDVSALMVAASSLSKLASAAENDGHSHLSELLVKGSEHIDASISGDQTSAKEIYNALDAVAHVEAEIVTLGFTSDDSEADVDAIVDRSFGELLNVPPRQSSPIEAVETFEVDDETLDIFRSEADELIANISAQLNSLRTDPSDKNALWEIRRCSHTFKGAAGIVGLRSATEIAHRVEDLLDRIVELEHIATPEVLSLISRSLDCLSSLTSSQPADDTGLDSAFKAASLSIEQPVTTCVSRLTAGADDERDANAARVTESNKRPTTPIVRVSLERLDELLRLSNAIVTNRSALAARLDASHLNGSKEIEQLLRTQHEISEELNEKLKKIRMVKFGNLETRLARNVHVTCLDEEKRAVLEIDDPEVEIDTQIIDALVEPLLHLLKNAVVHGIEAPETRRLIGKPERGTIRIRIESDGTMLALAIVDDGAGISIPKLKEKAAASGAFDEQTLSSMSDEDAFNLIFDRGITTAARIDLNAGRGVGMSIVKESIEARGGTIVVRSWPQRGTEFTIVLPLNPTTAGTAEELVDATRSTERRDSTTPLVLVVDDSMSIRRHNSRLIENLGYKVITSNDGAEALELLLSGSLEPDLIVTDVEMPNINGWELLEYLKTDDNLGHIPIFMVTSLNGPEHHERAAELDADAFLQKPLTELTFTNALAKVGTLAIN